MIQSFDVVSFQHAKFLVVSLIFLLRKNKKPTNMLSFLNNLSNYTRKAINWRVLNVCWHVSRLKCLNYLMCFKRWYSSCRVLIKLIMVSNKLNVLSSFPTLRVCGLWKHTAHLRMVKWSVHRSTAKRCAFLERSESTFKRVIYGGST